MSNKEKFGRFFYYGCLIFSVVFLLGGMFLFPVKNAEGEALEEEILEARLVNRYLCAFICLSFIIPLGSLIRELCFGISNKKIYFVKVGISLGLTIGGILVMTLTKSLRLSTIFNFISLLILLFILTVKDKKPSQNV